MPQTRISFASFRERRGIPVLNSAAMKVRNLLFALFVSLGSAAFAAEPQTIPVWPGTPPGTAPADYPETVTAANDGLHRVSNVTVPTLQVFLPEQDRATGAAAIVCPGGGFRWLSIDHEGIDVARWLNANGVAAFVLKYRLIRTGDSKEPAPGVSEKRIQELKPLAAADGQQAIRLVRSRAKEWSLDPHRIGIIGFSAGGYVAAAAALRFDAESRPDFAAPIYPLVPDDATPPKNAPALFIVQADDDKTVPTPENSARLYQAWHKAGISAELHIYSRGGHGFGMKKRGLPVDTWSARLIDWLRLQQVLPPSDRTNN